MRNLRVRLNFLPRSRILSFNLLLLLANVSIAPAREDSTNIPIAPFRITDMNGEIGLSADYFGERQSLNEEDSVRLSNNSFEEYFLMRLKGYIYHPRFLDFRTRVKAGLLQQIIDRSGLDYDELKDLDSNTFVRAYDVYVTFLKEHPLSISFFANRDRRPVLQLFTDRQLIETESLGAIVNWKNGPFPMDILFSKSRFREWGADSHSESSNRLFQYSVRNTIGDWSRSELRYRLQQYEQDFRARTPLIEVERKTDLDSHDLSLLNTTYFSEDRANYLNSNIRWYKLTGTQDLENAYWQERLQLQHRPNLRTYYLASYLRNKFASNVIDTYRAEAGIEHHLYQSLDTHLDTHWRRTEFDSSSEDEYGVTARLNYRKRTGWGYLTASYGRTLNQIERTGRSARRPILDEQLTLVEGITQFLSNPDVIQESIVVTDVSGLIRYTEGFDYEVELRGNRTGLRLLTGGLLRDEDTVLVDYEIQFLSDLTYITDDQTFDVRHDWEKYLKGLSLYYRWHDLSAYDIPSDADSSILEFTNQLVGFAYTWRQLTWTEEYESYRSTSSDYDQIRSQIAGSHRLNRYLKLGWRLGFLLINYSDEVRDPRGDDNKILFGAMTLGGKIHTSGFWQVEARARKETGRTEETLLGITGNLGFQWRKMRISAGARVEQQERFDDTRDRYHVYLQLARQF
jgi:hypothetical protein